MFSVNDEVRVFAAGLSEQTIETSMTSTEATSSLISTEEAPSDRQEFERMLVQRAIASFVRKLTDEGSQVRALNELRFVGADEGGDRDWRPQKDASDFMAGLSFNPVEVWNEPARSN